IQPNAGLGNMNPRLYSLAQTNPGVFHDITTGDNVINVTCTGRVRNCSPGSFGFNAGAGYDQVTGLGSVDAYNLMTAWAVPSSAISKSAVSLTLQSDSASITASGSAVLTATVRSANGGVPSGTVSFYLGSVLLGTTPLTSSGAATLALD